jgi:alpha-L-fucosidase 2
MAEVTRRNLLAAGAAGAALLPAGWTAVARAGSVAPPEVLAANDLALWYDEPAGTDWLRALPIGNGRLGAMVFGNIDTERLQLNEDTVWAGGPYDSSNTRGAAALPEIRRRVFADQWTQAQDLINQTMLGNPVGQLAYQPVGNLQLAFGSASGASQYTRTLDLTTATASTSYVLNGVRYQREVFASAPNQVIVVRLTADRANAITFTATLDSPQRTTGSSPDAATIALDGISGNMEGITGSVRFLALANASVTGGTVSSSGGTLRVSGATSVTLLVSIGSSYVNYRTVNGDYQGIARNHLNAARAVGFDQLRARHVADYQALFSRVSIDLGRTAAADQTTDVRIAQHASVNDPQFCALLFQFGRYLLISSSRHGTQPANLQGIWNQEMAPSWDSKYTLNANQPRQAGHTWPHLQPTRLGQPHGMTITPGANHRAGRAVALRLSRLAEPRIRWRVSVAAKPHRQHHEYVQDWDAPSRSCIGTDDGQSHGRVAGSSAPHLLSVTVFWACPTRRMKEELR